jgi:hypothetical protein
MSTGTIIGIIIAVVVVAAIAVVATGQMRRARVHRQFGPEYDRLARELGSQKKAEAELTARRQRVEALGIHPLPAELRTRYAGQWTAIQEKFVDTPAEAVAAAGTLIQDVMRDRGYPAGNDASTEALSVYHAGPLDGYRQARDLQTGTASTEQLREAMIRHRAMLDELVGSGSANDQARPEFTADTPR